MFIPTRKSQTEITVQFFGGLNNTEKHNQNQCGKKESVKYLKKQKSSQCREIY
jgi:hypothetical protein